MSKVLHYF